VSILLASASPFRTSAALKAFLTQAARFMAISTPSCVTTPNGREGLRPSIPTRGLVVRAFAPTPESTHMMVLRIKSEVLAQGSRLSFQLSPIFGSGTNATFSPCVRATAVAMTKGQGAPQISTG
jgi:hypothetical protein